jgi:hypothetical protein
VGHLYIVREDNSVSVHHDPHDQALLKKWAPTQLDYKVDNKIILEIVS